MVCLFTTYLLGVWLLLSQFPNESTAGLTKSLRELICNNALVNRIEKKCLATQTELSNPLEDVALQHRGLSELPDFLSHEDAEALSVVLKFIPELPQGLKALLSDKQSLLRTLQNTIDRGIAFDKFTALCCKFNCIKEAKKLACKNSNV